MSRKIFLDVGGHFGQSVEVVLRDVWAFDDIHTFEPDPDAATKLEARFAAEIANGRLTVHRVALSKADGVAVLTGGNAAGEASIVDGMLADGQRQVTVRTVDINAFLDATFPGDQRFWIKLNCEGGEADIVERLCSFERRQQIVSVMADFDIVKKAFGYYRKRAVLKRARAAGLRLELSESVMVGKSHADRIENWLAGHPAILAAGAGRTRKPQSLQRKLKYWLRDMRSAAGLSQAGYR